MAQFLILKENPTEFSKACSQVSVYNIAALINYVYFTSVGRNQRRCIAAINITDSVLMVKISLNCLILGMSTQTESYYIK